MKRVIVAGGSAGAISAFCSVLKGIPRNFRAPILAVIHVAEEANTLSTFLRQCRALNAVDPRPSHLITAGITTAPEMNKRFEKNAASAAHHIKSLEEVLARLRFTKWP